MGKYHLLKDVNEQRTINLQLCPSEGMTADALTKPPPGENIVIYN